MLSENIRKNNMAQYETFFKGEMVQSTSIEVKQYMQLLHMIYFSGGNVKCCKSKLPLFYCSHQIMGSNSTHLQQV